MNTIKLVAMVVSMGLVTLVVATWELLKFLATLVIAIPVAITFLIFGKHK